jgi:hypothetical protein
MFHPRWNTTHIHLFASLLFSLSLSPSSPVHGKGIECQSRETTPRVLASKPPKYSSLRRHQTHSRSPSLFHPSLLACFFKFYLTTRSSVSVSTKYTIELLRSRKGRDYRKEAEIRNYFPVGASCSVICSVSDFKKTTNSLKQIGCIQVMPLRTRHFDISAICYSITSDRHSIESSGIAGDNHRNWTLITIDLCMILIWNGVSLYPHLASLLLDHR